MLKQFRICVLALGLPSLGACAVADGVAHVVKLTQEPDQKSKATAEASRPASPPSRGEEPPPSGTPSAVAAPAPAPVAVETLAPPAR